MTRTRTFLAAAALGMIAAPAFAGGITFDLPRLQFPTDGAGSTRGCHSVTVPACETDGK